MAAGNPTIPTNGSGTNQTFGHTSVATGSVSVPANTLVAIIVMNGNDSTDPGVPTGVSDGTNALTLDRDIGRAWSGHISIWSRYYATSGTFTFTASFASSNISFITALTMSGMATSSWKDTSGALANLSADMTISTDAVVAQADEVAIAAYGREGTGAPTTFPGTGYTSLVNTNNTNRGVGHQIQYDNGLTAGSVATATGTESGGGSSSLTRVIVTYKSSSGGGGTSSAAYDARITGTTAPVPINTAAAVVTGTPAVGKTLTATPGTWTGATSVAAQWQEETAVGSGVYTNISGATATTYTVVSADKLLRIRYNETATNANGSAQQASNIVGPVGTSIGAMVISLELQSDIVVETNAATTGLAVRSASAFNSAVDTSTVVINKPAGTLDGDMMVAYIGSGGFGTTLPTVTAPAGWNPEGSVSVGDNDGTDLDLTVYCYTKTANAEPTSWTWTMSAVGRHVGAVVALNGGASDWTLTTAVNSTNDNSIPLPSVSGTANGLLLVCAAQGNGTTFTFPAGMTIDATSTQTARADASNRTLAVADQPVTTTGPTTAGTITDNNPSASTLDYGVSLVLALAPVAAVKVGTLVDNFDTLDTTTKWTVNNLGSGTVSVVSGQLQEVGPALAGNQYGAIYSQGLYDALSSSVAIQLVSRSSDDNTVERSLMLVPDADVGGSQERVIFSVVGSSGTAVLRAKVRIGGTETTFGDGRGYSAASMPYLRIRLDATTIYWEYTADPAGAWTTYTSTPVDSHPWVRSCRVRIESGHYSNSAVTTTALWDNLNTATTLSNITAPVLSGIARVGQLLSVTDGTWNGSPVGFTYEWQVSDDGVSGWTTIDESKIVSNASFDVRVSGQTVANNVYFGARVDGQFYVDNYGIASNQDAPWCQTDASPNAFDEITAHAGKAPVCIHWGGSGSGISAFDATADARARALGGFSNYSMSVSAAQLTDLINNVNTNGALTAIDAWANAVKTAARPILFRPMWEMNGNWGYTWQSAGISAANYIIVWRRIWQRIADIMGGFTAGSGSGTNTGNVSFYWCPNVIYGATDPTPWFPGASYVDWLGADGYNKNDTNSPSALYDPVMNVCRSLAPGKPLAIGEMGCEAPTVYSGGKSQWVADFFTWLAANTDVKMFSWFNETGSPVWPHIEVGNASTTFGGAAQTAFASGIAASRYISAGTSVVNSTTFPNGAKVPIP